MLSLFAIMNEMAATATTKQALRDFRIERYDEMGFTAKEAEKLADAQGDDGFALDYRKVKKALNEGCGHVTAIRIFT